MVVRTDANAAIAEYGREFRDLAVAIAMGESVRLTDAEVDAIVHGGPAGTGAQPSITDRDPGDESQAQYQVQPVKIGGWAGALNARITELEAENANLRADLIKLMASPPAPATAPTPPPHDPMANALAHSEPKPPWQR